MMKRIVFSSLGLMFLAAPLFASADANCPTLSRSLSRGSRGDDVTNLQAYLGVSQTGYFGTLTAAAVTKFQASEGISAIGIVGPLTRAAFARRCGNPQSGNFSASLTYGTAPLPVNFTYKPKVDDSGQYYIEFGDGNGQLMDIQQIQCIKAPCISPSVASHTYNSVGTYTATVSHYIACMYSNPRCMIATQLLGTVTITVTNGSTASAPSISGVDGPTTLQVNQQGTWSVHVNDSSGYLSYSVKWGDEAAVPLASGTAASVSVASSGTFTHTYAAAGTYSPTFTVTNGNSQSATASASVVVGSGSVNSGVFFASSTSAFAVHFATSNMTQSPSTIHDWYTVDFGDGTNAELALSGCSGSIGCVDHTYMNNGTYTARIVHHPDPLANCPTTDGTYCGSTLNFNTVTITVSASPGTVITKTVGEQEGSFLIQKINSDTVEGIQNYSSNGTVSVPFFPYQRTVHIGDDIGSLCAGVSEKLTRIDYNGQKATFIETTVPPSPCPVCLSGTTKIDTPGGLLEVKNIPTGTIIWTQELDGARHEATVLQAGKTAVPPEHRMVDLKLSDGRELVVSPGHPVADGRLVGNLKVGDVVQGAHVLSTNLVPNMDGYTYDILPSGDTGEYWADGILMQSTLRNK